jgi:hypothetical protein
MQIGSANTHCFHSYLDLAGRGIEDRRSVGETKLARGGEFGYKHARLERRGEAIPAS